METRNDHFSARPSGYKVTAAIFVFLRHYKLYNVGIDKLLRENYNQYFLLGICPSRLFRTFNEANILLIVYFDNMFDLQSKKLQLESV